jgi:N-acetylmuramoyl-L-alanine amidase
MAFISNPEQEALLTSDGFKNQVVQALLEAVIRYRTRLQGARRP